ncbi:MAG: DUF885 domain-containing protein [Acidobacteriota bacterium]|nr:DUF885 domain-containing protein [Acidobacteriota bacterium]
MKKKAILVMALAFAFSSFGAIFAQNAEDAKFQKILDNFLDEYWKFYPTAGTVMGFAKYGDRLEDLGSKAIEARHDRLDTFNQELVTKVDKSKLSADAQIDHEMLMDALDLEFVKFENLLPWESNPIFYNDILVNALRSLLIKDGQPLDARVKSATERAKAIPGLLKQAKANLKTPPQIYTETAVKQFPAILEIYKTEIPELAGAASSKAALQAELAKAVTALEDYQRFLQNELLPKSSGLFRLGDQVHLRLLRLTTQGNLPMDELVARATADVKNIRREMFLVCIPFYKVMYPNINLEQLTTQRGEEEVRNIVIKGVFDKIKNYHPSKEQYIDQIKASVDSVRNYLKMTDIIPNPEQQLAVESMPAASRGVSSIRFVTPGAYESDGAYAFQIQPVPDDWSPDQVTSYLEEYTHFYTPFLVVQRIYPGAFVPTALARKSGTLVSKLFSNQALINGWPIYTEEMLINAGFGEYDLRMRLNQLKLMLKTVMDFQLELNIHQGTMTQEQAVKYMMGSGFQTQAEAERKWNHIFLNPGDAAYPYIGYQEILDLAKEYKKLKGDAFSEKEFLQKIVSFGAISLRQLKVKLAQ